MNTKIIKYRRLEKYLNLIKFKDVRIGSLLGQTFELNYYNPCSKFTINFVRIIKYLIYLFLTKDSKPIPSDFIFTKLISRFHFNELMDPLIIHYLEKSTIICSENSFESDVIEKYPINERILKFSQTINNNKKDSFYIIYIFFKSSWILLKNKKRLKLTKEELAFFMARLLVQLRSVSFWNSYFSNSMTKPKCIVTEFDRNSVSSALILAAKKYNITSITLTHGVICDYGFTPVLADYIFCWGKFQQNQLIEQGVSWKKIVVTGNPMIKPVEQSIHAKPKKVICFAISPENLNRSMIELFASVLEPLVQATGIIKLHPSLHKEDFLWVENLSPKIIVKDYKEITNQQLFKEIDLLIIHLSGIANEALVAGVPVVILEPAGRDHLNEIQRELSYSAGCMVSTNSEELTAILNEFISNSSNYKEQSIVRSKKYIEDLFYKKGEESIQAMIEGINRITT